MAVVCTFIVTNLPYMVYELLHQEILPSTGCSAAACQVLQAVIGVSIVRQQSQLNIYLLLDLLDFVSLDINVVFIKIFRIVFEPR